MKYNEFFPVLNKQMKNYARIEDLERCDKQIESVGTRLEVIEEKAETTIEINNFILKRARKIQELEEFSLKRHEKNQELLGFLFGRIVKIQKQIEFFKKRIVKVQELDEYILKRVKLIQMYVGENRHKYNNNYERKAISSFYEYYERKDFKEKFMSLIHGLDETDIDMIVRVLQRQRLIKDAFNQEQDIFSEKEQQQICTLKRELKKEVFQVATDVFCYKHYLLPINHFEASVFVYKHGIDCIEDIENLRSKDILDVGGFIGDSLLVLKPLTEKRVISFEAIESNYELMKATVELNGLDNIILEHMALGAEIGAVEMEDAGPSSSFEINELVQTYGSEKVPLNTLDNYMNDKDYQVGLIKVDIEGAEQAFLHGAQKTIEKFKPVLLLSIYHNASDFFEIKPLLESWDLGYKFRIHKPVDYSVSREVLLIAEVR